MHAQHISTSISSPVPRYLHLRQECWCDGGVCPMRVQWIQCHQWNRHQGHNKFETNPPQLWLAFEFEFVYLPMPGPLSSPLEAVSALFQKAGCPLLASDSFGVEAYAAGIAQENVRHIKRSVAGAVETHACPLQIPILSASNVDVLPNGSLVRLRGTVSHAWPCMGHRGSYWVGLWDSCQLG